MSHPKVNVDYSRLKVVDLFTEPFDSSLSLELAKKVQGSMPCEEVKEQIQEITSVVLEETLPLICSSDEELKYIVTAGLNRYGNILYLYAPIEDLNEWAIGRIPCPLTFKECKKLINIAQKGIKEKAANTKLKNFITDYPFEITKWNPKIETTSEENIARGKQLLEELRKQRNS